MSARPLIGLCAAVEDARWGVWSERVALLPYSYSRSIQRAGGVAVMLPPDPAAIDDPSVILDRIDGLVMAGGSDIDPASYGADPHPTVGTTWPERDAFEIALARAALERDMPFLGVCRGMQLLNVALGGGIEQHLPDRIGHEEHRHTPGTFADHQVRLADGSLAARVIGHPSEGVKSHHHQGIDGLGDGLVATGWSEEDNDVVEAIEVPQRRFALGVLWHPEEDEQSQVLKALVDEARSRIADREEVRS
jgi:putative glutamine amidotransferase